MAGRLPLVGAQLQLAGMREYERDSNKVIKKTGFMSRAFGGMGTAGTRGGSMLIGALTGVLGPMGIVAAGALKIGKNILGIAASGGSLRGIQMVFDNLTQSYGINADILERLRASTKGAVTDFELMKQTNKALVGAGDEFGKMFGEKLPLLMAVSREAAKAQGQSVEFMFDSIVTGIKRSSPMILDNLGFQFSLAEANKKYAESIGKTTKELSKEEKQIALLNAVTEASQKLIEQTGGSLDTSAKQALAWGTSIKNVRDRMAVEWEPVLLSVMGLIGKPGAGAESITGAIIMANRAIVGKIIPAIDGFGDALSSFISGPGALFKDAVSAIGKTGFEDIWEGFASIFTSAKLPSFRFLGIQIKTALRPVLGNALAESISEGLVTAFAGIGKAFQNVKSIIGPIASAVGDVFAAFAGGAPGDFPWEDIFPPWLADVMYDISSAFEVVRSSITDVFTAFASGSPGDFPWEDIFPPWLATTIYGISTAFESIRDINFGGVFGSMFAGAKGAASGIDIGGMISGQFKTIQATIGPIAGLVANVFGEVGKAVSGVDFADVFTNLVSAIKKVFPVWLKMQKMLSPMGLIFTAIGKAGPNAFQNIWKSLAPVLGSMAMLIGNIVTLIYDIFLAVWPSVESVVTTAFEAITDVLAIFITSVIPILLDAFNVVLSWFNESWPMISEIFVSVFTIIAEVIDEVVGALAPFIVETFAGVVSWVNENWPLIASTIQIVLDAILDGVQFFVGKIEDLWKKHGKNITKIINALWAEVKNRINTAIKVVQALLKAIMLAIHGDWQGAWLSIQDAIVATWEGIKETIDNALIILKAVLSMAWENIKDSTKMAWDAIKVILSLEWAAIKLLAKLAWDGLKRILNDAWDAIEKNATEIWERIKTSLQGIWDSITGAAGDIWGSISQSLVEGLTAVANVIWNVGGGIRRAWDSIWSGFGSVVESIWDGVKETLARGVNAAINILNKMIEAANRIPGVDIPTIPPIILARGGILNRPTFVAGEAGAEVVAPLRDLLGMMSETVARTIQDMRSQSSIDLMGMGSTQIINNITNEGDEFNLETRSVMRDGGLQAEFQAMSMASI